MIFAKHVLLCEDSVGGIFTAVYEAWRLKYGHDHTEIEIKSSGNSFSLFSEYIDIPNDPEKAGKVGRTIKEKLGDHNYQMILKAAASADMAKADAIYRYVIAGLKTGALIYKNLADPAVMKIFELNRNVGFEMHEYQGFLRFNEINDKILLAVYSPKNDITAYIMPHFADRLNPCNFIILDSNRSRAGVHDADGEWFMTEITAEQTEHLAALYEKESVYEDLWKTFFETLAIKERENRKCQMNHIPLHYRTYMPEFKQKREEHSSQQGAI